MDGLIQHQELPGPKFPTMIVAFAGWPDAAEAATRAVRYLVRKLPAKKFASIDPEEFFSDIIFAESHDRVPAMIASGEVDLGAAKKTVINKLFESGDLRRDQVRVLEETPPYADYVWATQGDLNPELRGNIRNGFLSLSLNDRESLTVLQQMNAQHYLPATLADYHMLRDVLEQMRSGGHLR